METKKKTVYIDCTATKYLQINTGIQRVVRNLIDRKQLLESSLHIKCVPVFSAFGRFWEDKIKPQSIEKASSQGKIRLADLGTKISIQLDKAEEFATSSQSIKVLSTILTNVIRIVRRTIRGTGYFAIKAPFLARVLTGQSRIARVNSNDILLLPDSFWAYNITNSLQRLEKSNVQIVPIIHDLIPITNPEYCSTDFIHTFRSELEKIARHANGYITVSNTTRRELTHYLAAHNQFISDDLIRTCYLGSNVDSRKYQSNVSSIRHEMQSIFEAEGAAFLMVGTIEPRKGHEFTYKAISQSWDAGSNDRLIICGRIGWMCKDLISHLQSSRYLNKYLFLFHDATDEELRFLYERSTALIFASNAEGFGLPLVEALSLDLPVVATDIPIFREIGGENPTYFTKNNENSLLSALRKVKSRKINVKVSPEIVRSWDVAAVDIVSKSLDISSRHFPT